ncbi:hypothetical protein PTKIN_Ptkin13bG0128600 [Pterospermum kingtungense]
MSMETPVRLPVIDFSKKELKPGTSDSEWDLVKAQVRQALLEYGCFEALFDKVLEVREATIEALQELFGLPLQTKKCYVSEKPFHGYHGDMAQVCESFFIHDANTAQSIEGMTNILWPEGKTCLSKTLLSFTELASGLERTVKRMILEIFGVEKYLDELVDSTYYSLRLIKYQGPQTSEPTLGTPAHCDQNMLTLLYQNEVNGLEIQTKDGGWINVKPSPDAFIVMIGESLNVLLNGRLSSPCHRVIMTGNKTRYCFGLFTIPRGGYQVKVPEELVNEENPLLFKPFDYEEFMVFHTTPGVADSSLKAYCSV